MSPAIEPILRQHPVLTHLRYVTSWWALAERERAVFDSGDVDPALLAWIELERSMGDEASAATHESLRLTLSSVSASGLTAAFEQHARRQRAHMPDEVASALVAVDQHVHAYLDTKDLQSLLDAEQAWVEVVTAAGIDALPVPLRLSLVCDAAALHGAVFSASPNSERLQRLTGILHAAMNLFREFDAHPPLCRLHLDPRLQVVMCALANALRTRFGAANKNADLEQALGLHGPLIQMTHPAAPDAPLYLAEYGKTLGYQGNDGVRAGSLALARAARLEPAGSVERVSNLTLAGRGHLAVFAATSRRSCLNKAIAALTTALEESSSSAEEPRRLLAEALFRRAGARPSERDAVEAVGLLTPASDSSPDDGLADRILQALTPILPVAGARAVIEAALDVLPPFTAPEQAAAIAMRMSQLAWLLQRHDAGRGRLRILDMMILLLQTAQRLDNASADAAGRDNNLAVFLRRRFAVAGDKRDLGEASNAAMRALGAAAAGLDDQRHYAGTYGTLLVTRFDVSGAPTDLDEAIAAFTFALPESPADRAALPPKERAGRLGNLGVALRQRWQRRRQTADLDRAIDLLGEAATAAVQAGGVAGAHALNNLGSAYHDCWRRDRSESALAAAIAAWAEAEEKYLGAEKTEPALEGAAKIAAASFNLSDGEGLADSVLDVVRLNRGSALLARYEQAGRREDLDEALRLLPSVIDRLEPNAPNRATAANRIAHGYHLRFLSDRDAANLAAATEWSRKAVSWSAGTSFDTQFRAAWDWGGRAVALSAWSDAAEAYSAALSAMRMLFDTSLLVADRERLAADAFGVPTRAAYALSKIGDARGAVCALEYGRALLLTDALGVIEASLEASAAGQHGPLLARYHAAVRQWHRLADQVGAPAGRAAAVTWLDIQAAQRELWESRDGVISVPTLASAFGPPSYADIAAAEQTSPLVYLVPGPDGGVAIVVTAGAPDPELIPVPAFSEKEIAQETRAFVTAAGQLETDEAGWTSILDRVTHWVGNAMAPVQAALTGNRAILIPTGTLVFLPLHAGWIDDPSAPTGRRYIVDDRFISYAPSALSLAAARRRPSASEAATSFLGISDPRPSVEPRLIFASAEVARAAALFTVAKQLDGPAATADAVRTSIAGHDVVHYAAHARSDPSRPRRSGIVHAGDQMVTAADFSELELNRAKLAVLSACETGVPGVDAPDEIIGIATAFFSAGFDGVVASLWPILDVSALLLITRFYEYWRGTGSGPHDPAAALVLAQQWVRDTTNGEKHRHWSDLAAAGSMPRETYDAIARELQSRDPARRDFATPDNWAAFTFTGIW